MLPEGVSELASVEEILSAHVSDRGLILDGDVICGIREVE